MCGPKGVAGNGRSKIPRLTTRLGQFHSVRSWLPTRNCSNPSANEFPDNGQQHWIGKVSDAEKTAVKVAPEVLAKYVGVYKGLYLQRPREVEVTLSGDTLFISLNGAQKRPIVAQSETGFSGTGLTYQFIRDDHGIATHVIESRVSGDYKYERQK